MFKLLHISDLHAGKTLNKVSRNEDLAYALEQVSDICLNERVDVLLIAGDIFDKAVPDYSAEGLILEFLTEWAGRGIEVVLIAGNHDSYDKLRAYTSIKKLAGLHIFDRPSPKAEEMVFQYKDLAIACLPYPSERVLTTISEDAHRSYSHKVAQYLKALAKAVEGYKYRILLAHLMVEKGKIAGSEREASVSSFYAIRPDQIPDSFHYVALGHLHLNQKIESAVPPTHYSGSLYQIDFSEKGTKKFVNLVILEEFRTKVQALELSLYRQLKEVRIAKGQSIDRVLDEIKDQKALFKVILEADIKDPMLNLKTQKLHQILGEKLVFLNLELPEATSNELSIETEGLDLLQIYRAYYKQNYNQELPEEIEREVFRLLNEVQHETHQA
jgi:exonuclease SbcD